MQPLEDHRGEGAPGATPSNSRLLPSTTTTGPDGVLAHPARLARRLVAAALLLPPSASSGARPPFGERRGRAGFLPGRLGWGVVPSRRSVSLRLSFRRCGRGMLAVAFLSVAEKILDGVVHGCGRGSWERDEVQVNTRVFGPYNSHDLFINHNIELIPLRRSKKRAFSRQRAVPHRRPVQRAPQGVLQEQSANRGQLRREG